MVKCFLCEQDGENPICNQNDGTITYFCDFHYAQAMGRNVGIIDRFKHALRHRGGSMRGEPQKMSKKLFIGLLGILFTCIFFISLNISMMFKFMPIETLIGLQHASVEFGFTILVCIGLGWYIYWKDNIKTRKGKIELILSLAIGLFLFLYPILTNLDSIIQWLSYFF